MDSVLVEVFSVDHHFESDNGFNGLYNLSVNGTKAIVFRNGNSWAILSHWLGKESTKCLSPMREDRIKPIEEAVNRFLND